MLPAVAESLLLHVVAGQGRWLSYKGLFDHLHLFYLLQQPNTTCTSVTFAPSHLWSCDTWQQRTSGAACVLKTKNIRASIHGLYTLPP